jgi:hypothetical protein
MAWNEVANDTAAVLSAEVAGAGDKCAYLPGKQSRRSGDRLSACVAFGWRGELTCSHGLAAVLDDLRSTVRLVLVNSSRAWSSSGGVVVIERQVEVWRTIAGLWRLRRAPNLLDQNPRSMGSMAAMGAVMPAVGADRAVCDPLPWWPSDACVYCVSRPSAVGEDPAGFNVLRAEPADDQA